uniref:Helicase-like transcription factor CHR28 n=1 Tax=Nelumbo nucifera TaxID=4432 RepID=A0A822YUB5_NELNU|nr:TPA_asm: hypothetical protein HUJ06_011679 [Nelumbo nucifera]
MLLFSEGMDLQLDFEIQTPVSDFSKFSTERRSPYLASMASVDPIEINSSDSEGEVLPEKETSFPRGSAASSIPWKLPSWASTSSSNSHGYGESSQKLLLPRTYVSNKGPAEQFFPSSSDKGVTLTQHFGETDVPKHLEENQNVGQPVDPEKLSSQETLRRKLPALLQFSAPTTKPKFSLENGDSSCMSDAYGRSNHSVGTNVTDFNIYMKDNSDRVDDEIVMYESSGIRVLPSSLVQGRSVSSTHYACSSNPVYVSGLGDEKPMENDERLIFQAALQDLSQPKLEATPPDGLLAVPLLRHQKIALAWMLQKELPNYNCLGGILADDQGLGKTVSMIALIQMQRHQQPKSTSDVLCNPGTEALSLDDDDDDDDVGTFEPEKLKCSGESDGVKMISEVSTSVTAFRSGRPAAGTLVVCPASVLRQWARELDDKVADGAKLSVLVYHGGTRTRDPVELAKYDVVLTTYSIVTNEVPKQPLVDDEEGSQRISEKYGLSSEFVMNKKRKMASNTGCKKGKKGKKGINGSIIDSDSGPLARVVWSRVILDEAQTIKNHRTQVSRACSGLRAKRRWCLSGTPIQNAIDDLYSYFRFLKYDPYTTYKTFCDNIKYQISKDPTLGYRKLRAILKPILLRRTKGTLIGGEPIINLPPKVVLLKKVEFTSEERAFYSQLEADSRSQFKEYADAGTVNQNYANILLMLLRLRQACDHPCLVKGFHSDSVGKASFEMARKLPREMLINLLNVLETTICSVCSDLPEDAVVTICGHVFCYQCVSEYLTGDDNTCPAPQCKEQLGSDVVFSRATLRSSISDDLGSYSKNAFEVAEKSVVPQNIYSSSKIRAALDILLSHCKLKESSAEIYSEGWRHNEVSLSSETTHSEQCFSEVNAAKQREIDSNSRSEGTTKAIVFSQWTRMLDLLEISLKDSFIQYRRLDGTMSLALRDKAVKDFNSDPEVTVMLMSLKAGNLGLNMVAACHVILLDLWWNPTTEDQAVDRAHRIGQTRQVTVSRLTVKDTVEDRILALQEEKRKMVASALGEDLTGGSATRLTVDDLRYLFMI